MFIFAESYGGPDSYPHTNAAGGSLTGGVPPPQHPGGTYGSHSSSVARPPGGAGSNMFSTSKISSLAQSTSYARR